MNDLIATEIDLARLLWSLVDAYERGALVVTRCEQSIEPATTPVDDLGLRLSGTEIQGRMECRVQLDVRVLPGAGIVIKHGPLPFRLTE